MSRIPLTGYTDRPNARPGEQLDLHLSTTAHGAVDVQLVRLLSGGAVPEAPPFREEVISEVVARIDATEQRTVAGSHVVVPDEQARCALVGAGTVEVFVYATLPSQARQGILGRWDDSTGSGWLLSVDAGRLVLTVGDGQVRSEVTSSAAVFPEIWYWVTAGWDSASGQLTITQSAVVNRVNGRFGLVVDLDTDATTTARHDISVGEPAVPVVIGGVGTLVGGEVRVTSPFNGKLDAPTLYSAPGSDAPVAAWDFAANITLDGVGTDEVVDTGPHALHGRCVNQPDRGMTGHNWDGREENFVHAPRSYGAMWFHEDALDDCRWPVSWQVQLPEDLPSGCYAFRLRQGDVEDHVPFFVAPPSGRATAKALFLVPTFTYLAYANSQVMQNADVAQSVIGVITTLEDTDLELHERIGQYGLSLYDSHADGPGVHYSTWRRPILNMRPSHRHEYGSAWAYPADLDLVAWLDSSGIEFDVATDHDLVVEGRELLDRYNVVMTASHPEYYDSRMLDAWEDYLAGGGRGMYLGGNGFYWVTTPVPAKPWVVEVRRGESGDQAWRARPGEYHHSSTGERGGLWRGRARAPQKLWGVGYISHCLDSSAGYLWLDDAGDDQVAWMVEGIDRTKLLGGSGGAGGGAAGLEVDHIDYALGTPPNTMFLGSSQGLSVNATLVPEEQYFSYPGMNGREHPAVRADIAYFTTRNGGAVFSTGSIAWCASLGANGNANDVSRLTRAVLTRFAQDDPVPAVD